MAFRLCGRCKRRIRLDWRAACRALLIASASPERDRMASCHARPTLTASAQEAITWMMPGTESLPQVKCSERLDRPSVYV